MYQIKTDDIYEDFTKDKEMFDFSNYSTILCGLGKKTCLILRSGGCNPVNWSNQSNQEKSDN